MLCACLNRSVLFIILLKQILLKQIGDAAAIQSPLSFGGFGAMLRHLPRLAAGVDDALTEDRLRKGDLALLQPYQPSLSAAWLFQRWLVFVLSSLLKKIGSVPSTLNLQGLTWYLVLVSLCLPDGWLLQLKRPPCRWTILRPLQRVLLMVAAAICGLSPGWIVKTAKRLVSWDAATAATAHILTVPTRAKKV